MPSNQNPTKRSLHVVQKKDGKLFAPNGNWETATNKYFICMQDASQSGTLDENQNRDTLIIQREIDETEPSVEAAKEDAKEPAKNDAKECAKKDTEEAAAIERLRHIDFKKLYGPLEIAGRRRCMNPSHQTLRTSSMARRTYQRPRKTP